jgi:hypothetical protein
MDADRFDTLSRTLSQTPSRRGALRLLAGFTVGGLLSLGVTETEAHDARPACKKKSGKQKKKCLKKARKHNAAHLRETPPQATCATACAVPACQRCQNGTCVAANQGQPCANSATSGEPVRCCDGACPDPACTPSGYTGQPCTLFEHCAGVTCCSKEPVLCENAAGMECFCPVPGPGEPCGSDADCNNGSPARACICGTCQEPL